MSTGREPAPTLPGFLPDAGPLTLADHIPTPSAVGGALAQVAPQLLTGAPVWEMIGALSDKLPHFEADREAGG